MRAMSDETIQAIKEWLEEDKDQCVKSKRCIDGFTEKETAILERFGDDVLNPIGHSKKYMIINVTLEQVSKGLNILGFNLSDDCEVSEVVSSLEQAMDKDTDKLIEIFKELVGHPKHDYGKACFTKEEITEWFELEL